MNEADSALRQAQRLIAERKAAAIERAVKAYRARKEADAEYESALLEADSLGVAHTKLAREFGVSETAVRLYIKRRKRNQ